MKNKNTTQNARFAIGYILGKISDLNYEPIKDFLDNIDVEIEAVKLKFGLGFSHKKIYLDLLRIYQLDKWDGHLTLYVFLHEVGHVLRIKENKNLQKRLDTDDFEVYYEDVLVEEEAANDYAVKQFKLLTGLDVNPNVLMKIPDSNSESYREQMLNAFNMKQSLGSWDKFIESLIDRDFVFRTLDATWNTDFSQDERMVRASINGDFYNPFDLPDDINFSKVMINAITLELRPITEGESVDFYNEKDVISMNPFNSKYTTKSSYENGVLIEASRAIDGEWEPIDLETLGKD